MRVVFVHGACVRDGAWWWHRTAELLLERGVPSVAPPLPSCGEGGGRPGGAGGPGLPEDVAAVRRVLQDGGTAVLELRQTAAPRDWAVVLDRRRSGWQAVDLLTGHLAR